MNPRSSSTQHSKFSNDYTSYISKKYYANFYWNCEGANEKNYTTLNSIIDDNIEALIQDTCIKEHPDKKDVFKIEGYSTYSTPNVQVKKV